MVGGRGIAILVGVVQFVGIADHHVVGVGSAHRRLMVIVVQGVFAGELGQIGRVALGDVVEAHRDIAFLERVRRRIAVAAGGDGLLDPGEQVGLTAACIVPGHLAGVAVKLLPHLVEAMHRAPAISRIKALGGFARDHRHQRIGAVRQVVGVQDAGIGRIAGDAGCTRRQQRQILRTQAVVAASGLGQRGEAARTIEGSLFHGRITLLRRVRGSGRLKLVGRVVVRSLLTRVERIGVVVHCRELRRPRVVRTGRAVLLDNSLGQEIVDVLAVARHVSREHMVESPVFADNDDDVLDRAVGPAVVGMSSADRIGRVSVASDQRQDRSGNDGAVAQTFRHLL